MKTSIAPFSTQTSATAWERRSISSSDGASRMMSLAQLGRPFLVDVLLGQRDRLDLQELDRERHDPPLHDEGDRLEGRPQLLERDDEGAHDPGLGLQMEDDLGDDPERSLRADDEVHEVVAGARFLELTAELEDIAFGCYELDASDIVADRAVLDGPASPGVRGHEAAHHGALVPGVGRKIEPALLDGLGELG
jgi:hypothetical protein